MDKWINRWHEDAGDFGTISREGQWWYGGTNGTRVTLVYYVHGSKSVQRADVVAALTGKGFHIDSCRFSTLPPNN